ncbi:MAG: sigma-70 family RNA polymerase sigma factor [Tissierellia bacterium]|nr:sigma-70 family RNA polymerase sigma factor [Tissierellia bacterium]
MKKAIDDLMIERALNGSKEDIEDILLLLEPLIKASIKRYYNRNYLYEDLVQDGRLKLLEYFKSYDPSSGVHFLGYAKMMLKFYFLNRNRDREDYSLDDVNEDGLSLIDIIESDDDIESDFLCREEIEDLRIAMDSLTDIEKSTVIDFYFNNLSISDISEKRNVSYRTVVNNKTRAVKKLRDFLQDKN